MRGLRSYYHNASGCNSSIFGSAFCASLKVHTIIQFVYLSPLTRSERQLYFREIQPTLEFFPSQFYSWLLNIVSENERDMELIHPVLPDQASADRYNTMAHSDGITVPKGAELPERPQRTAALR